MALTLSTMLPLGTVAAEFRLVDTQGRTVSLGDFPHASAYLVAFICNHCPYVKHVAVGLANLAKEYQAKGVAVLGISSNDAAGYPDDAPEKMVEEVRLRGYTFPYLFDETQQVAQAYGAACTPDFYVFDRGKRLAYRGQMDDSRPGNDKPVTGACLRTALEAVLAGQSVTGEQVPSMGCNIKWRAGNEPAYFKK